ncbi:MAG: PKD domain-containing protein [Thermoplasmatota archaeon]
MLFKILLVIASILSTLAQVLMPGAVVAPTPATDVTSSMPAAVPLEKLATVALDGSNGPLNVLWVNVDGQRQTQNMQAQGYVKDIEFAVGTHLGTVRELALADSKIPLTPTDVVTVREFTGTLNFNAGVDSTLALTGSVQATFVNEANLQRIATEGKVETNSQPGNLAYVVLNPGQTETTVGVSPGGDHVVTGSVNESVAIPVTWVRVGDKIITDYTWSDGYAKSIEFLTTPTKDGLVLGNGSQNLSQPEHILLEDFVGTYVILQSLGGGLLLKLDGYAQNTTQLPPPPVDPSGVLGSGPQAHFTFDPNPPSTSDVVLFTDNSTPGQGSTMILVYQWTFGDGGSSSQQNPQHRFTKSGSYNVTETVTDSDLRTSTPYSQIVTVVDSPPVAEFDFSPKAPTDLDTVQFTDKSWDIDGTPVRWAWDLGDGNTSTIENPIHQYADDGNFPVRLTTWDDAGFSDTVTKIVPILNVPPLAQFSMSPQNPDIVHPTQFQDLSTDPNPNGRIVQEVWSFGDDASSATGPFATHQFHSIGTFNVALAVTDDDGSTSTVSTKVTVQDLPPIANYEIVTPAQNRSTGSQVCFVDTSTTDTNQSLSHFWNFSDGAWSQLSTLTNPCIKFPSGGIAYGNLTVTDAHGLTGSVSKSFSILYGPPTSDFLYNPVRPYTQQSVVFAPHATDPDGPNAIVSYVWWIPSLGLRQSSTSPNTITANWAEDGIYAVFLNVTNQAGGWSNATRSVAILDRAPSASFALSSEAPSALAPTTFTATNVQDPDGHVTELSWAFGDGYKLSGAPGQGNASNPTHTYRSPGSYTVTLQPIDDDHTLGSVYTQVLTVNPPPPTANFSWSPAVPLPGQPIQFTDHSTTAGSTIVSWAWSFGDRQTSTLQDPQHGYASYGTYTVSLAVVDNQNPPQSSTITKQIVVNAPPVAAFTISAIALDKPIQFVDQSSDVDGSIVNRTWSFGDGAVAYNTTPTHTYTQPGTYNAMLKVRDDGGATATALTIIHIINIPPTASFVWSPTSPVAGNPVTFTSTSTDPDDGVTAWSWTIAAINPTNFLAAGSSSSMTYTFAQSGQYKISLTAFDASGGSASVTTVIRVLADQPKTLTFPLDNPDGTPFQIASRAVTIGATVRNGLTGGSVRVPVILADAGGGLASAQIPAENWSAGDSLHLSFSARATGWEVATTTVTLTQDSAQTSTAPVLLQLRAIINLVVHEPQTEFPLLSPPLPVTGSGDIVAGQPDYHNLSERVIVTFTVTWEGTTSPGVDVSLGARTEYIIMHYADLPSVSSTTEQMAQGTPIIQQTVTSVTNANGMVDMAVPYTVPLGPQPSGGMVSSPGYLPGWYRIDANVAFPGYHPPPPDSGAGSATGRWFEDPAGAFRPLETAFEL